jgi:hypothetical protein
MVAWIRENVSLQVIAIAAASTEPLRNISAQAAAAQATAAQAHALTVSAAMQDNADTALPGPATVIT